MKFNYFFENRTKREFEMYIAFIDESGTPNLDDLESKFYILAAVVMKEPGLNYLHNECESVKQDIWEIVRTKSDPKSYPAKFEIHMDDINGRRNLFQNLKNDIEMWLKVARKVYDLISRLYIKIISTVIVKEDFRREGRENVQKWAFELLVEKINRYIESESENDHGLLVMDSVDIKTDIEKRQQIIEFLEIGTGHGWEEFPERIINFPFIVDSRVYNGLQIVDAAVYLLRWYLRKVYRINPKSFFHKYSEDLIRKIANKFLGFPHITTDTVKFFPTSFNDIPKEFWNVFTD